MGRMLGSYDSDELDRPDLNKCPDCGCFFAQDNCPLCGKICPVEMRAGNRKAVKQKKTKASSGRVTFINWYHSWWFILIMFFIFPIAAIALLITSPYSRKTKIIFVTVVVLLTLIFYIGIGTIISLIANIWDKPVDTSLSKEEYIIACENVGADSFYRTPDDYEDKFICLELVVKEKVTDYDGYDSYEFYICSPVDDSKMTIFVRDCIISGTSNFAEGDVITVYGEGDDEYTLYDEEGPFSAPTVNAAYAVLAEGK